MTLVPKESGNLTNPLIVDQKNWFTPFMPVKLIPEHGFNGGQLKASTQIADKIRGISESPDLCMGWDIHGKARVIAYAGERNIDSLPWLAESSTTLPEDG